MENSKKPEQKQNNSQKNPGEVNASPTKKINKNPHQPSPPQTPSTSHTPSHKKEKNQVKSLMDMTIWDTPVKFDRFLVITPTGKDVSFKEYSPLKIGKELRTTCLLEKTNSVQKSGKSIIVEVVKAADSTSLKAIKSFLGNPVEVTPHRRLNTSQGVIKHWEFRNATIEEWKEVPGVLDARQIMWKKKGEKEVKSPLWILTFDQPTPPVILQAEYTRLQVRPYVRKPLRCFNCQRFGHQGKHCRGKTTCVNCGKAEKHEKCTAEAWCPNCKESGHSAASYDCPEYKKEKLILEKMAEHGGSYVHVRDQLFPKTFRTYAQAASQKEKTIVPTEKLAQPERNRKRQISSPEKNNKVFYRETPPQKKLISESSVLTRNRFQLLSEMENDDENRFNFTNMNEAMTETQEIFPTASYLQNLPSSNDQSPPPPCDNPTGHSTSVLGNAKDNPPVLGTTKDHPSPPPILEPNKDPPPPPHPPPPPPPPPPKDPRNSKGNIKRNDRPCPLSYKGKVGKIKPLEK